jgi:hypothetical protein
MYLAAHTLPLAVHQQQRINLAWDTQKTYSLVVVHALVQALTLV